MMLVQGRTLVENVVHQLQSILDQVVIGSDNAEQFHFLSAKVIPDQVPDQGPLMGIVSCLAESSFDLNFVTGCDIPEMNQALIEKMITEANGKL